ncbi:MAG: ATP-binding protein, partial [Ignavibacteriae bacterium]|nr:ATP-binding protein [Ignavibacteriota bacterium]
DLESQWVGKSVKLLSTYFAKINAEAKKNHVIVFIDEIDAFLPVRDSKLHQSFSQRVTVFLEWMDGGIYPLENVTLIGTTNCLNNLDPAAKRPGRFDRIIEFKPLNSEAIVDCFKVHLDLKQLEENQIGEIDWDRIKSAVANVQLSGAAIPNILDRILIEKAIEHSNKISASTEKAKKINPNDISFYPTPISTEDLLSQITIFLKSSQE